MSSYNLIKFNLQVSVSFYFTLINIASRLVRKRGTLRARNMHLRFPLYDSPFISVFFRPPPFVHSLIRTSVRNNVTYCVHNRDRLRWPLRFLILSTKYHSRNFLAFVRRLLISRVSVWACYHMRFAINAIKRISNRFKRDLYM